MKNKVALVIPYFGKLPSYFPMFISSMKNKPVDVLFFSNNPAPDNLPSNIIWRIMEFEDVVKLFNKKLETSVAMYEGYKLCDLKPSFGFVFEDFLEKYDFWGTSDVDIVMGNFEKFINDEVLNEIDVYSCVSTFLAGPLFLVRNNFYCNTLFKNSKDWAKVVSSKKNLKFCEVGGDYFTKLRLGASLFNLKPPIQSFTEVLLLEARKGLRLFFTDTILETKGTSPVKVTENEVTYKGKEYLLLHYIFLKQKFYFYFSPKIKSLPGYINTFGMFKSEPSFTKILFSSNFINAVKRLPFGIKRRIRTKFFPPDKNHIRYLGP